MRSSRQSGSEREWNFGHLPHNVTERGMGLDWHDDQAPSKADLDQQQAHWIKQEQIMAQHGAGSPPSAADKTRLYESYPHILTILNKDEGFFDGKGDTPPPPLKKRRRSSASSLSSYSGSSSFGSSAHNSSAPVGNSKTSEQPTAAAGLGTLLATLDSAPVTIRGRSRKHFAGAAAASC
ncbi:unnamed protein product [Tilletia laevis]|nr:unnamed protein product [Tilletia controversa]CAD6965509.1 unnamed protein product [Tilletia laevis]CAD6976134.1 unnamed protein product [Tilletia controversa]